MTKKILHRLKAQLKKAGISQDRVALEAGVTRVMVNHVLNGRSGSRRVSATITRLLAEHHTGPKRTFNGGEINAILASLDGDPRAAAAILAPHGITVVELNPWATARRLNDLARARVIDTSTEPRQRNEENPDG